MNSVESRDDKIDTVSLMFEAARSYIGGAKIIMASDGIEDEMGVRHPTLPVVTCSTFAIELQLKLLLQVNSIPRPPGDGHDLKLLFDALPTNIQDAILVSQTSYTDAAPTEARQLLYAEKDTFKNWRYPYEKPKLETAPSFLFHFALSLSDYIKANVAIERSDKGWLKVPGA
jgi:hypothetical protein